MEKKIKISKIIDGAMWDSFIASSAHGTVFSTKAWLDAGAAAQGGEPVILGAWDGDELIAGVAYTEISRGPLKKANTPVLSPYSGFIYNIGFDNPQQDTESLQLLCAEKLIDHLQRKYNHVLLSHAPDFSDVRPFSWSDWTENIRYTYILDISYPELLWKNTRERARRKIRKARENLKIGGPVSAEVVADMHERFYRDRHRTPPVSKAIVKSMIENLHGSGLLDITTVQDSSGGIIALQVTVIGFNTVYTLLYGTLPDSGFSGADSLLIWDTVEKFSATHARLDLVGANIPSIAFFKKGFGGTLTPYYVTEYYSSPLAHAAFTFYSKLRKYR